MSAGMKRYYALPATRHKAGCEMQIDKDNPITRTWWPLAERRLWR